MTEVSGLPAYSLYRLTLFFDIRLLANKSTEGAQQTSAWTSEEQRVRCPTLIDPTIKLTYLIHSPIDELSEDRSIVT